MKSTIDLKEVARILGRKAPEEKEYLFWYTVFTLIANKTYRTLTEDEASEALKRPKLVVYYCKFPESKKPLPGILKNRRGMLREEITSHEQLSSLIYEKTGVSVPEADLMPPPKAWDSHPLSERIRAFMKSHESDKVEKETVARILKCLQVADAKKRKECLNNCNKK